MVDIPSTARVVIIGGGAVGASCLYHLAKAGWADCMLLEKNELTCGSTWHAAGNVPTFSASWSLMNMQRYSTELYRELGDLVDYPMNYHVTGSIRLAHSFERMQEFERASGMGRYQGMDIEMCSVADLKDRYPFLEIHDLEGGLYDPGDGDIDPAQLTQAFAKGARDMGAKIERFCAVTSVHRESDEWVVSTPKGDVRCEYVVNAAGYRAQEVGAMFGRFVPMMTMSHQFLLTNEIPQLEEWSKANDQKLPLLRDVDSSYYLRQEKFGLNLGPYEHNCKAHWVNPDDPMPEDFSFQLFGDDLERLEWHIEDAIARVPLLGSVGVNKVINGPIPYAPDGNPLIGPMPGVPNAFEACVFTFGIAQAGGAGKVLSEWVTEGATEWDMWSCDPRRFTGFVDQDYCNQRGKEIYGHEYAMHFPRHEWPAGRNKKLSSLHELMKAEGAQFGAYNGWERATWFAKPGDDTRKDATQTWKRQGPWHQRIKEECETVRDNAGILAISGFTRIALEGPGCIEWFDKITTSKLPKVGRIGLGYFADERGRLVTEMSIIREAEDIIWLITAATAQSHDFEWLANQMPEDATFTIADRTDKYECILLTGPNSRNMLAKISDGDLDTNWLNKQAANVRGHPCILLRVSFAGELGWEIHCLDEHAPEIWQALRDDSAKPFGVYALDSLRLEKGYRAWKGDLSTDYSVLESGLERFINWEKQDFLGKTELLKEKQIGSTKKFVTLTVDCDEHDAPYMSTLWHGGEVIGETTSGGWGHRVKKSIALGMARSDLAVEGTKLQVEIFGNKYDALVMADEPLWDPENLRLRS